MSKQWVLKVALIYFLIPAVVFSVGWYRNQPENTSTAETGSVTPNDEELRSVSELGNLKTTVETSVTVTESSDGPATAAGSLEQQALRLLESRCAKCHKPGTETFEDFVSLDVLDTASLQEHIEPGFPERSFLVQVIKQGEMPPEDSGIKPLSTDELGIIESWIRSQRAIRQNISLSEELATLAQDFKSLPAPDSAYYFTLRQRHNNPAQLDKSLDQHRAAFTKLLNSLSWSSDLIIPQPVDAQRTVYRIDINDLDWNEQLMKRLSRLNPYRVIPQSMADSQLDEEAVAAEIARDRLFRIDWFVAKASEPTLYHQILFDPDQIDTLDALYSVLDIDFEGQFEKQQIHRAYINVGDRGSGPSDSFRVLDELKSQHGPFWISYDFSGSTGKQNVDYRPWGPVHESREQFAFEQAGGEIIFSLPNGMLAFMLIDGEGKRIDEAPKSIVEDDKSRSPLGTSTIHNGASCFRCHAQGFLSADLFRPSNAEDLPGFPRILDTREQLGERVGPANLVFQAKLSELDLGLGLKSTTEDPVSEVIRSYRSDIDPAEMAWELEVLGDNAGDETLDKMRTAIEQIESLTERQKTRHGYSVATLKRLEQIHYNTSQSRFIQRKTLESIFDILLIQFDLRRPL